MESALNIKSKNQIPLAIISSFFCSFFYTIMLAIAKIFLSDCPINQIVFFRSLTVFITTLFCISIFKKEKSYSDYLKTEHIYIQIIRSIASLSSIYLFLFTLKTTSIATTSVLLNTHPIFVPFVCYIWKKNPIDHKIWPGIFLSFAGIIFLTHPETPESSMGIWIGLLGGLVVAISTVVLRFAHYSEPILRSIFYYTLFSSMITGVFYLLERPDSSFSFNLGTLTALLAVGIAGFLSQLFFATSIKYAPAKLIAPFSYFSIIFGLILEIILYQKNLELIEIFGIFLVLGGLYLMIILCRLGKKNASLPNEF